jgi:signal transduction histidine kinase
VLTLDQLASLIGERVDCGFTVPLLVLRVADVAQNPTLHFNEVARRTVRPADAIAAAPGGNPLAIGMLAPGRAGPLPETGEAVAALRRVTATVMRGTGRRVESGWWPVSSRAEVDAIALTIDAALERGNRERERRAMLATVGHELRTPLTSIRGYVETLLEGELDPSTARRFLQTARREVLRLGRLVEGMLEFSMLDLSTQSTGASCNVVEQINATIDLVAPLAAGREITIRTELPESAHARIDGDACVHALANLAENAVKYGSQRGTVEISCTCEERFVQIAVEDDGDGIAPGEIESIFVMGVRGGAPNRSGNGIGLAVVKAIVERAGGEVRVESSALGGARFVLRFQRDNRASAS